VALTQMQEAFCQEYVATGGKRTEAAERAGYGGGRKACGVAGTRLASRPDIQQRVFEITRERFITDAPAGRAVMMELATSAKSELVRFHAAKDLLDRAGHQPTQVVDVRKSIAPSDVQALEDLVRSKIAALGINAIDVTPTEPAQGWTVHEDVKGPAKAIARPER